MEWLLRRNYWLVKLCGVLLVSAFVANTATTLFGMWLMRSIAEVAPAEPGEGDEDDDDAADEANAVAVSSASAWRRDPEKIAERILGRSAFCPTCLPEGEAPAVAVAPDGTLDFAGARRSELPLEVAATMEASDPQYSLATIRFADAGYSGLFAVGDALGPGVQIVGIAGGRVEIVNGASPEYIPVGKAAPAPSRPATPAKASTSRKPRPSSSAGIPGADEAIKCDGTSCQVERKFVEGLIASPAQLVGQGRAAPAKTQTGEDGFKIAGVRRGTLPHLLGLENGDIITEVGGKPLTMDSMMTLTSKIRSARHIEVTIDRRGTKMTKALELV
jgi:hypothetical protein